MTKLGRPFRAVQGKCVRLQASKNADSSFGQQKKSNFRFQIDFFYGIIIMPVMMNQRERIKFVAGSMYKQGN